MAVSPKSIVLMLENEIDRVELSKEMIEHTREMLRENLYDDGQKEVPCPKSTN